jgi:serine/threonine-protein phosphatase 2B regulatory subunit
MCPLLSGVVTEDELKRLYRRFKKLDKDNSGTLTTDEFLSVPELAGNPLLERVIAIFDKNKDDEIEFKEFISALSTFSEKGNKEGKLRCRFPI